MTSIRIFHKLLPAATLALALLSADSHSPGWAQFTSHGQTGSSGGGASRGGCPNTPKLLKALVPIGDGQGGLTIEAHPTVWVYVPYTLTPEKTIEFVLRDEQNQEVYQTKIPGNSAAPGIVSLTLPYGKMAALEVGKTYTWTFMVYCDKVVDRPAFVSGWVKRVAPDPALKIKTARSPQERSTLYTKNSIWYDALNELGSGLRAKPTDKDLTKHWIALLQLPSVGLDKFAIEPVTDCCTVSSKVGK